MDYSTCSDGELLLIFKSGDVRGFNALFKRHWEPLFRLSKKILENEDLAKDVLQETFVALYENSQIKDITHVKSYLFKVVKYQCFMQLRSGKISEKHINRLQIISSANSVEEYIDATELENLLLHEIELLPDRCREVFYLSRYELLSNKKIAEQLHISQKTVEHQITKALKMLRMSLDKMALVALLLIV
jgi:RNA polymerase sigma-70 factor (family 1)